MLGPVLLMSAGSRHHRVTLSQHMTLILVLNPSNLFVLLKVLKEKMQQCAPSNRVGEQSKSSRELCMQEYWCYDIVRLDSVVLCLDLGLK